MFKTIAITTFLISVNSLADNASAETQLALNLATMVGGNAQHTSAWAAETPRAEPGTVWEAKLGQGRVGDHPVMGPDGNLYVTLDETRTSMRMVSVTSAGKERWRSDPIKIPFRTLSIPALTPSGFVVVGLTDNTVRAFRQSNGELAWTRSLGESVDGIISSPAIDKAGNVYIGAAARNGFYKLNGLTGDVMWIRQLNSNALTEAQQPERKRLQTEFSDLEKKLSETQKQIDEPVGATASNTQEKAKSRSELFAEHSALEAQRDRVWSDFVKMTGSAPGPDGYVVGAGSSPALSVDEKTVYIGYAADEGPLPDVEGLYALNSKTGEIKWRYRPDDADHFRVIYASPVIGRDGKIYQQDQTASEIHALTDKGGRAELKWKYNPNHPGDSPKITALDDDTLYVSTNPSTMDFSGPVVAAVNLNGEHKWIRAFPYAYQGTSPVVTSTAVLQCTAENNQGDDGVFLYALDKNDGTIMWRKRVSTHTQSSESEIIGPDGTIYMALRDVVSPTEGPAFIRAYHKSAVPQPVKPIDRGRIPQF
ncbi:MAG: PQQ-binding-like beta-propeller repeat protein [Candidatus Hydrogenedentes bacterium]|nr:PQQ-binding-like beta-propeller repeat protein [Candidatus Hydrogenedentota bacterium]